MHDAKRRLGELVAAAERGEDVVIVRDGTPAVRLVALRTGCVPVRLGVLAGKIETGPDFDDPLQEGTTEAINRVIDSLAPNHDFANAAAAALVVDEER